MFLSCSLSLFLYIVKKDMYVSLHMSMSFSLLLGGRGKMESGCFVRSWVILFLYHCQVDVDVYIFAF